VHEMERARWSESGSCWLQDASCGVAGVKSESG
jgi:hypothetical protein